MPSRPCRPRRWPADVQQDRHADVRQGRRRKGQRAPEDSEGATGADVRQDRRREGQTVHKTAKFKATQKVEKVMLMQMRSKILVVKASAAREVVKVMLVQMFGENIAKTDKAARMIAAGMLELTVGKGAVGKAKPAMQTVKVVLVPTFGVVVVVSRREGQGDVGAKVRQGRRRECQGNPDGLAGDARAVAAVSSCEVDPTDGSSQRAPICMAETEAVRAQSGMQWHAVAPSDPTGVEQAEAAKGSCAVLNLPPSGSRHRGRQLQLLS